MRIAFTGAGGTGKSTIALELCQSLGLEYMKSPSRACFSKHGVLTEDAQNQMTKEQRYALQMDIFEAIDKQVFSDSQNVVFDRTHLDNFFYACWQCRELVTNDQFQQMWNRTWQGLKTFDAIFFCPLFPWQDTSDGMRTSHLPARMMMDHFIAAYLAKHVHLNVYELPNEPVDMRLKRVLRTLESITP